MAIKKVLHRLNVELTSKFVTTQTKQSTFEFIRITKLSNIALHHAWESNLKNQVICFFDLCKNYRFIDTQSVILTKCIQPARKPWRRARKYNSNIPFNISSSQGNTLTNNPATTFRFYVPWNMLQLENNLPIKVIIYQ